MYKIKLDNIMKKIEIIFYKNIHVIFVNNRLYYKVNKDMNKVYIT